MPITVPISTPSALSLDSSEEYLVDSASAVTSREDLSAYLSSLTAPNKADLRTAVGHVLPIVSARLDAISRELKSSGFILSDTMNYAKEFKQEVDYLSFVNVNSLLVKSADGTTSSGKQIFAADNFELMKQYKFKQSLADFYTRYSGHLQDRRERLSNALQTLTTVHDNLTMIWDLTQ